MFDIERPFEFGSGVAVKLLEKRLTLAADFQFSDWTQTEYDPRPAEDVPRDNFERFYDSALQIRAGAEYRFPEIDASVRLGYFRDPIPFAGQDENSGRNFLTLGVGKVFDDVLKFDLVYIRGSWEQSSTTLKEEASSNRLFVSAAYRY